MARRFERPPKSPLRDASATAYQLRWFSRSGFGLTIALAVTGAVVTIMNPAPVQWLDCQTQRLSWHLRSTFLTPTTDSLDSKPSLDGDMPDTKHGQVIHGRDLLHQGRCLVPSGQPAFPHPYQRGLYVLAIVVIATIFFRQLQPLSMVVTGSGLGLLIGVGSCLAMAFNGLVLPTVLPMVLVMIMGSLYAITNKPSHNCRQQPQLPQVTSTYPLAAIAQETINHCAGLPSWCPSEEQSSLQSQLRQRYQVTRRLSAGGFGATYLARDLGRAGHPYCVIKQLRPANDSPETWKVARRLFLREAETLERLGQCERIPQLRAYFEEDGEFYLVQDWVDGHPLSYELSLTIPNPEIKAMSVLSDLLPTLDVIHQHGVIHRDIKPDNIIRRHSDHKLVLIDFGAVKEIRQPPTDTKVTSDLTIGIGTRGYTPSEQAIGRPKPNSDIYALGMVAIQIMTGLHPRHLRVDPATGNVIWRAKVRVNPQFADVLDRMVCYNFRDRYPSATAVLADLQPLLDAIPAEVWADPAMLIGTSELVTDVIDPMGETKIWQPSSPESP
ncbi:MAG: serine/threonine protein kinase [Cyanobacteria bacterium]|nr:serine/threonine protein kinase [Cyanobacteriota bacterium]MDW8201538.1 serine/threonine-protein kinase [Cyanobacteriota bacterium SKYGB_h_bin112]